MDYLIAGIIGGSLAVIIAAVLLIRVLKRTLFIRGLEKYLKKGLSLERFVSRQTRARLLAYVRQLEKPAKKYSRDLVAELGLPALWIENLYRKERAKDLALLMKFAPDAGLFSFFRTALGNKKFEELFVKKMQESTDVLTFKRVADSCRGADFDADRAYALLSPWISELRDLLGDTQWPSRYFAVKILTKDADERSRRALWDSLRDPYPLVRLTVVRQFFPEDAAAFTTALKALVLDDPSHEVRRAAAERLRGLSPDAFDFREPLPEVDQLLHVMELLDPVSDRDESFALQMLKSDDDELKLAAAYFLSRSGGLDRLLAKAALNDREELDRTVALLSHAASVGVADFLDRAPDAQNEAIWLAAARILATWGAPSVLQALTERLVSATVGQYSPEFEKAVLEAVARRGNAACHVLVAQEIRRRLRDGRPLDTLLASLDPRGGEWSAPVLIEVLKTEGYADPAGVIKVLATLPKEYLIPPLLDIIKAGREKYSHQVRLNALAALTELKLPYTMQTVLENLVLQNNEERRQFTDLIASYAGDLFRRRVEKMLAGYDSGVRSALVAALPGSERKAFAKQIREGLSDADPDVRIAAVWALADSTDAKAIGQAQKLLYDPVAQVRCESARTLGAVAGEGALPKLREILFDDKEFAEVKESIIQGLGMAKNAATLELLLDKLAENKELENQCLEALKLRTDKKDLLPILERFKDENALFREKITLIFKSYGESVEKTLAEMLEENISSVKPYLVEALEASGYVEDLIRSLKNREPRIRRTAAVGLARVGTLSAFRALVLAARDPDENVRVEVVKALEKLDSKEGKELLDQLSQDPEKKIRAYTEWALAKIHARDVV